MNTAPEKIYINEKQLGNFDILRPLYYEIDCKPSAEFPLEYIRADLVESKPVPGMSNIIGLNNAWPLKDVLSKLVYAAEYLLHEKSYDGHVYEEIGICVNRAKDIIELLGSPEIYASQQQEGSKWEKGEELLREALLQIEYLHSKFKETGSGNSVIAQIKAFLPQQ